MRKQSSTVEWHITENETEWARLATMQTDDTASRKDQHLAFYKNACWALACILGLLLTLGGWWWHNAHTETQRAGADYNLLVADLMREFAHPVVINDSRMLTGIPTGAADTQLASAIVLVEVQGEQAIVSIVTAINAVRLSCREQRLYDHTTSGWQQTLLDEEALAPRHQQETASATFGAACD